MAKRVQKTNAIRLIEQQEILYELLSYKIEPEQPVDGIFVSKKIGYPFKYVYKTLVGTSTINHYYVFVVPVLKELNLKKAAKVVGQKKIEMVSLNKLREITGYNRGGCSPIGMKKVYPTYIDIKAEELDFMIISAGKIGMQIKLLPKDLAKLSHAKFAEISV